MTEIVPPVPPSDETTRILNRLRRLEGQIRGIQTMVESGKECEAILTQVMAVKSAISQVGMQLIGSSMKTCLIDSEGKTSDEIIDEAMEIFQRYAACAK